MTVNAPISSTPPRSAARACVLRAAVRVRHWCRSLLARTLHNRAAVRLSPFFFPNGAASGIAGEGGSNAHLVPNFIFHSDYIAPGGRKIRFKVRLRGLTARAGKLALSIDRVDNRGGTTLLKTRQCSLRHLAADGGVMEISIRVEPGYSYGVIGTLTDDADAYAEQIEVSVVGGESSQALSVRLDAARREFLSSPGSGELEAVIVDRRPTLSDPISQMCTANQMIEPIFTEVCARIGQPHSLHRKQWEFAFILRALEHHGAIKPGHRGLGFGVGIEPMSSFFAAAGCEIVATDLPSEDDRARIWHDSAQLGGNLRQMHYAALCSEADFFSRVSYRAVDMNAIPDDLKGFDFTWSSCAYEHLGSIDAGLAFFENSLACLKKGGIAVHTTELNLSSNDSTIEGGGTVLFRRRDFETLARRLIAKGHEVMPITFDSGDSELDRLIDLPPYTSDSHLKLALLRWVSTSFGMIVRKG